VFPHLTTAAVMTTLTAPDPTTTTKPPGGPGAARLRLRRAGAPDKLFELSGGKCTIGSSPRCHVCLPAAEAQPLQCLLSLEAGAAFATKWASGVLLNGQSFAKAAFGAGDRLSIGPWEIEWDSRETPSRKSELRATDLLFTEAPRTSGGATLPAATTEKQPLRETVDFTPVERVLPKVAEPLTLVEPASARLRETIDFPPVATVETSRTPLMAREMPTALAPTTHVAEAPLAVDAQPTPAPKRPAAKTMLIASRETDPFADLLGPGKPIVELPVAAPVEVRSFASSQTFEDRLVASLWTSNFAARKRAKNLAAATRKARGRVQELSAGVATLEEQLAAARSASESMRSSSDAARTANEGEIAELRTKLESLRGELVQALEERDRAAADLAALQNARPRTAPPDPRLQTLADAVAKSEHEAADLRETLAACQEQIETLRAERSAAESALATAENAAAAAKAAQDAAEQAQAAAEALAAKPIAADKEHHDTLTAELAAERADRERERKFADDEAARLREQLYACETQLETLRAQVAEVDAARDALGEQLAAVQQQQNDWLVQCKTLEEHRAAQLAEVTGERDELQRQLDELAARPAAMISNSFGAPAAGSEPHAEASGWRAPSTDVASTQEYAEEFAPTPAVLSEPIWRGWDAALESAAESPQESGETDAAADAEDYTPFAGAYASESALADEGIDREAFDAEAGEIEPPEDATAEYATTEEVADEVDFALPAAAATSSPEPTPEAPAKDFAPTSFIDKYKHLLEDEGETPVWPSTKHQLLDEEHMSPSKPTPTSSVEEDSDEALEAYMSNMMRRMRSGSAPSSHAMPTAPVAPPAPKLSPVEQLAAAAIAKAAAEKAEAEIELDDNGMLRMVRKPGMATADFAALRELANSTARTAIAEHRQRRHVESAVTKSIACAIASGASAYLMVTAPGIDSPWFWGGCVALVAAVGSAAQLGNIVWQKLRDGGRTKAGVAAGTAPEGTT
jgi:predicted  nucleic acid-binding Zn-ribbon protein